MFNFLKENILRECSNSSFLVKFQEGERFSFSFQEIQPNSSKEIVIAKDTGVYWITGGLGGLGLLFAKHLSSYRKNITLILSGRSELSSDKLATLKKQFKPETEVYYHPCDIADQAQVNREVDKILVTHGKINGIFHSAGVLRDSFLVRKDLTKIKDVVRPKINGAMYIAQVTQDIEFDYLVLFSSEAGAFGNIGQTDYAASNSFLDGYAAYLNKQNPGAKRILSINWPLWNEGGMQIPASMKEEMATLTGMIPLDTNAGLQAFENALQSGESQVMVGQGDLSKLKKFYEILSPSPEKANLSLTPKHCVDRNQIAHKVRALFKKTSLVDEADINEDTDFRDYGADSVIFSELADAFSKSFELSFSPAFFFEYPNLKEATDEVVRILNESSDIIPNLLDGASHHETNKMEVQLSEVKNKPDLTYHIRLDGQEIFFKEHKLMEKQILPGAMFLELIMQTLRQSERHNFFIRKAYFERPLFFSGNPIDLYISIKELENNLRIQIYSSPNEGTKNIYVLGEVYEATSSSDSYDQKRAATEENTSQKIISREDVYSKLNEAGFEYGKSFQTITQIQVFPNKICAQLKMESSFLLDTSILPYPLIDGAFQSIIGFSNDRSLQDQQVPYSVENLKIYKPFSKEMKVIVEQLGELSYKLEFYNLNNELVALCASFKMVNTNNNKADEPPSELVSFLIDTVASITGIKKTSISPLLPLAQVGIGHAECISLHEAITNKLNIDVSFQQLKVAVNLQNLASTLSEKTSAQPPNFAHHQDNHKSIEQMSPEEIESALEKICY